MEACLGSSLGGAALLRQATWLPAVHAGMGGSRRSAAGRCPLVVCQAQLVDFSPSRYNAQWRQRQHRRLLLLQAHEAAAAAQPSAGATPATPLDALASTIQLHSPPSSQLEALLAQLPGGRPAQAQQKPRRARASKAQRPDHGTSASSSSSTGGSAENEGWLPGDRARRVPPQLSNPWKSLSTEARRAYLQAVRSYYGEGVLYERRLPRSGRVLLALVDNRMQGRLEAHLWRERPRSRGGLYTEAGPHPGRTYLARWTAEECLVGASQLAGNLAVASWSHKDGCPANCLARNLEVTLVSEGQQGGRPGADAPGSGATAEAKAATRAVLARLYNAVGAAEARRFLQALHREHLALRPGKKEAA